MSGSYEGESLGGSTRAGEDLGIRGPRPDRFWAVARSAQKGMETPTITS